MDWHFDLAFWLGVLGGGVWLLGEARNRSWLGVATVLALLAGVGFRVSPIPESISSPLSTAFFALFLALTIVRVVRSRKQSAR